MKNISKKVAMPIVLGAMLLFSCNSHNELSSKPNTSNGGSNTNTKELEDDKVEIQRNNMCLTTSDNITCRTFIKELDENNFTNIISGKQLGYDDVNYSYIIYSFTNDNKVIKMEVYPDAKLEPAVERTSLKTGTYSLSGDDILIHYDQKRLQATSTVSSLSYVIGFGKDGVMTTEDNSPVDESETISKSVFNEYKDYISEFEKAVIGKDSKTVSRLYNLTSFFTTSQLGRYFGRTQMGTVVAKAPPIVLNSKNGGKVTLDAWAMSIDEAFKTYLSPSGLSKRGGGGLLTVYDNYEIFPGHVINGSFLANQGNMASYNNLVENTVGNARFGVYYGDGNDVIIASGILANNEKMPIIKWQDGTESKFELADLGW